MKHNVVYIFLLLYGIACITAICIFDGTADSGDSVMHYLYAKHAFAHPQNFFNHWAKPLYVLLAAPFAQFGFVGVKIFNSIVSVLCALFIYKFAKKTSLQSPSISVIFFMFIPLNFILVFSGLTEPLFALFLIASIYFSGNKQYIISAIIISFLPFIRSEGIIFLGVFGLFFLIKNKWKYIPFLFLGHIVYSIAGYFVHRDLFWTINKIPYITLNSVYGHGKLFHFADKMYYVVGLPILLFFCFGVVFILFELITNRAKKIKSDLLILVFVGFVTYFIAHSLFWYLGIFNSMGLERVLIGVAPLIALIALLGFNFIFEEIIPKTRIISKALRALFIIYVLVFPFTSTPGSFMKKRGFNLGHDQLLIKEIADYLNKNEKIDCRFVYSHPYFSEVLQFDHFDIEKVLPLNKHSMDLIRKGDVVIWDNWFSVVDCGITEENMNSNVKLNFVQDFNIIDGKRNIKFVVYEHN